ncbi:MAG TPA: hypothetical protein VG734_20155 [Lacunisphaera sp.]|nr:hypothetical protein [Lacunisphaera sp.]
MKYLALAILAFGSVALPAEQAAPPRHTNLAIVGDSFLINGEPTFKGRTWRGHRVEGLLPNARVVQGIFDDLNPATRDLWVYPDTGKWDPDRNTREFVAAMPSWRQNGLLAITLNLQGGSPLGYGNKGWINTAFTEDGSLRPDYFGRLERILDRADELGMVVILGLFYFGQDQNLRDEAALLRAADLTLGWLHDHGYRNLIIEACNESTELGYHHDLLRLPAMPRFLQHLRGVNRNGWHFPVGVSLSGGEIPTPEIVAASDVILIHGNNRRGVETTPTRIREMIAQTRALPGFRPMPVLFNEDDHYAFDQPDNNFLAATENHVSWGFFDFRRKDEPFTDGFQSVPVDWTISSPRKRAFFELLQGFGPTP